MGGEVERDRQALLAGGEVAPVERVGLLGRGEPGVLADGPRLGRVHRGVGAAQVGRGARHGVEEVEPGEVGLGVERLDRDLLRGHPRLALGHRGAVGPAVAEVEGGEVGDGAHREPSVLVVVVAAVAGSGGAPSRSSRSDRKATTSMPSCTSPSTWSAASPSSLARPATSTRWTAARRSATAAGPVAGIGLGARREDGDLRPLVGRPDAGRGEQVGDEGLPGTELAPGAQRVDDDAGVAHGHGPVAQPLEHHRVAAGCQGALTTRDGGARPAGGGLLARHGEHRHPGERALAGEDLAVALGGTPRSTQPCSSPSARARTAPPARSTSWKRDHTASATWSVRDSRYQEPPPGSVTRPTLDSSASRIWVLRASRRPSRSGRPSTVS